jgi:CopA family copper-resistance protein
MDRTGYARGTLAPAAGMEADIPPLDPRPVLSMADMGMSMGAMNHGGGSGAHDMPGMDMSGMSSPAMGAPPTPNVGGTTGTPAHDMDHMDMSAAPAHNMADMPMPSASPPPAKFGPNVDMVAQQPNTSLSDPGVGLRNNGRRVLTYADLHTIGGSIDSREPGRDIRLHLTGHMQRFVWSFDGQKFSESQPLRFNYGERLRVVLINDSMMNHPIHLHGMWSEVESPEGEFLVRKHTIIVQPGQQLSYGVTANALGRWAFHCHLLYHMEAGMFREVAVEQPSASDSLPSGARR